MEKTLEVSEVKVRLVDQEADDLVGWASCVINGALYLNNIAIRRRDGGLVLVFPAKRSRNYSRSGQKYFHFNPISREAKRALDEAILGKLARMEDMT